MTNVRAVLLSLLLVTTAFAAPMTGTVAAQSADTDECSTWDSLLYDAMTIGGLNTDGENPCSAEYAVNQVTEEWNETDAEQTRTHIHSQAGQLSASNEQFLTVQGNYLKDTETTAWSKGEAAAVEALANGATISEAKESANDSVEDYYTVKQLNMLDRWDVVVETYQTLRNRSSTTSGIDSDFVYYGYDGGWGSEVINSDSGAGTELRGFPETSVVLANSSSAIVKTVEIRQKQSDSTSHDDHKFHPAAGHVTLEAHSHKTRITQLKVRPTSNFTSKVVADMQEFNDSWAGIEQQTESVKEELGVYIEDSLGPAIQSGDLNAQNYVSSATLAAEYAQDYNGSESYVHATALAATKGFSTPDLNATASMTISHDGETYTGLILSQEAPAGGWETNQVYDPTLIGGMQFFARSDVGENETAMLELDGEFSVKSIEGTNGEQIQNATPIEINYQTSNASGNYSELQQQIRNLSSQIEARQQSIGGTNPDGSSGGLPSTALIVVAVVALGAFAMNGRDD